MTGQSRGDYALSYGTTKDLVAALAAGKISALELTDHVIARIEAIDPTLNAVVARALTGAATRPGAPILRSPAANGARSSAYRWSSRNCSTSPACRPPGACRPTRISSRKRMRSWSPGSRPPARSSSARRTCRTCWATSRATTRFTAPPIIRGTSAAHRADRRAGRRRHSPPVTGRCRWAPTSAARCATPRTSAESTRTSRHSG